MWYSLFGVKINTIETAFITSSVSIQDILKDAKEALLKEANCWHRSNEYEKIHSLGIKDIQIKNLMTEEDIINFFSNPGWLHVYPWGELSVEDIPLISRIKNKSLAKLNYKKWLK